MKPLEVFSEPVEAPRAQAAVRPALMVLFWLVFFAEWTAKEARSWNDASNLNTIHSLVHYRTWAIDEGEFPYMTGDRAQIRGRLYSARPPVLAALGACIYAVAYLLGCGFVPDAVGPFSPYQVVTVFTSGLASAVLVTLFWMLLRQLGVGGGLAAGMMISLGAASMLTVYTTVFNHHTTAAGVMFVGLYGLARARLAGALSRGAAVTIGGTLGLAATIDPAGGGLLLLLVLASLGMATRAVGRQIGFVALGVAGAGLLHAVLNYQITGDVVPALVRPAYFRSEVSGVPREALSGVVWPQSVSSFVEYAKGVLFGWRGLVVFYPLAVPAAWATVELVWRRHPLWRELGLAWLGTVVHVAYLLVFTNNYSGNCYGIRWFVLDLPVWYLLVAVAFASYWGRVERALVVGLAAYSGFMTWHGLRQGAWSTGPFPAWDSPLRYWVLGACAVVSAVMTVCLVVRTRRRGVPGGVSGGDRGRLGSAPPASELGGVGV